MRYEKKAEELAEKHKELQGQLGDLNMLADNLNTHRRVEEVEQECADARQQNDQEAEEIDGIFLERRKIEAQIKQVEADIEEERGASGRLVKDMTPDERQRYNVLKGEAEAAASAVSERQARLDKLNSELESMEKALARAPVKREAVALYDQVHALEARRDKLSTEVNRMEQLSPEAQRERLLEKVKADNQETAGMERRIQEMELEMEELQGKLSNLEEADGQQDEAKRQKYMELVKKDREFDAFLDTFDENYSGEKKRIASAEQEIVSLLEKSSRLLERTRALPSKDEANGLAKDLAFKTKEMTKSQTTAENVNAERVKLARKLENVQNIEGKVEAQTRQLRADIERMEADLVTFGNLDAASTGAEDRKREMEHNVSRLSARRTAMRAQIEAQQSHYDEAKTALAADETHSTLASLEKKWQHFEKKNFAMRDFIAAKDAEANFGVVADQVHSMIKSYNRALRKALK